MFDDDGNEFALKVFDADEEEGGTIDIATLREISVLRLLRGDANGHPSILQLHDVTTLEESGELCMAMPVYRGGDLEAAIKGGALERGKGAFLRLRISSCAQSPSLADNGVIHRDIKSENIMLSEDMTQPVLIDFSLAVIERKNAEGEVYLGRTHSGDVGSAGYIAPEVYDKKPYGTKADAWSIGVVIMELFRGKMLEVEKDKQSFKRIREVCDGMPSKPFPNLIKSLLVESPDERASARSALGCELFAKKGLPVPDVRIVDIATAIPARAMDSENDNGSGNGKRSRGKGKAKQTREEKNVCAGQKVRFGARCKDRRTYLAAEAFAQRIAKQPLESLLHEDEEGMLRYCAVLAQKMFEEEKWDLGRS